ncbi:hypothetical protein MMC27_003955 [Xylographa pallens]|nr:hypothetical protein [Xylographa pallens]
MSANAKPEPPISYMLVYDEHSQTLKRAESITSTATKQFSKVEVNPEGSSSAELKWKTIVPDSIKERHKNEPKPEGTGPCMETVPCQKTLDIGAFVGAKRDIATDRILGKVNCIYVEHCRCLGCFARATTAQANSQRDNAAYAL